MKHRDKQLTALLLAAVMTVALAACGEKKAEEETGPAGVAVQVETVAADTITAANKVSGRISADNEATIMAASTAKCTAVFKNAGDTVEKGDVLCTLDMGSTLASYDAARISYDAAVRSYQDQKSILDKQVKLAKDNVDTVSYTHLTLPTILLV